MVVWAIVEQHLAVEDGLEAFEHGVDLDFCDGEVVTGVDTGEAWDRCG